MTPKEAMTTYSLLEIKMETLSSALTPNFTNSLAILLEIKSTCLYV